MCYFCGTAEPESGKPGGPRMSSDVVNNILRAIIERYALLRGDLEQDDTVETDPAVGSAWFKVHKLQGEEDLIALIGYDSEGSEVMDLQHYSQLNLVFHRAENHVRRGGAA
jgi:hypothetical protein